MLPDQGLTIATTWGALLAVFAVLSAWAVCGVATWPVRLSAGLLAMTPIQAAWVGPWDQRAGAPWFLSLLIGSAFCLLSWVVVRAAGGRLATSQQVEAGARYDDFSRISRVSVAQLFLLFTALAPPLSLGSLTLRTKQLEPFPWGWAIAPAILLGSCGAGLATGVAAICCKEQTSWTQFGGRVLLVGCLVLGGLAIVEFGMAMLLAAYHVDLLWALQSRKFLQQMSGKWWSTIAIITSCTLVSFTAARQCGYRWVAWPYARQMPRNLFRPPR